MANTKKRGPVRQFSLQCDSPKVQERKKSLIRQLSEDITDSKPEQELSIRISVSTKTQKKNDKPPPTKIAWSDTKKSPSENNTANDDAIVVKKCTDTKKASSPRRIIKQSSLDRESILYSRQELAERLRQAWKDRESSKPNLNIILAHATTEPKVENILTDVSNNDRPLTLNDKNDTPKPKIILPLKPDLINNNDTNMKNVFQKHIRRAVKQQSLFDDSYSPTRTLEKNEEKCSTIVVPIIDNKSVTAAVQRNSNKAKILTRHSSIDNNFKEKNSSDNKFNVEYKQSSRPSTASSKREIFQKRTNSAFHGSVKKEISFRPPLLRASSVPLKAELSKPKFVATKRRVKTAKAKLKIDSDDENNSERKSSMQRCVSVAGVMDIVTMVSLVSPSGSENEEDEADEKENEKSIKSETVGENKTTAVQKSENTEEDKNFSLRKTVKSVSFQQSSIHAVRSFSASFPGRRSSMATTLFLNNDVNNQASNHVQKIQEKRAPINLLEDEETVPKRRLVRTKSAPADKCGAERKDVETKETNNQEINEEIHPPKEDLSENIPKTEKLLGDIVHEEQTFTSEDNVKNNTKTSKKFENPKEKQCWDMYRKMNEKGVVISFDTILRGMLTPTEYRLRRKPSLVPEDNCEITEN